MSVDQQIREGLVMLDQRLPTPDTSTTYEVIVREARTRTRKRRRGGLCVDEHGTVRPLRYRHKRESVRCCGRRLALRFAEETDDAALVPG